MSRGGVRNRNRTGMEAVDQASACSARGPTEDATKLPCDVP
eukprot:gene622-biopygen9188